MTITEALQWVRGRLTATGTPEPALEGEMLVREAVHMDAAQMYANLHTSLSPDHEHLLSEYLERRQRREPIPYILGHREFYGRSFQVDSRVLIPRPETELLVERALAHLRVLRLSEHVSSSPQGPVRVADVGTGSGILAVTLAAEWDNLIADAVDVSRDAIAVARRNAIQFGVEKRITFREGELLAPLAGAYDVLVSNPPYIATDALKDAQPELGYEPSLALNGGKEGSEVVFRLLQGASKYVNEDAFLMLIEMDPGMADAARSAALQHLPNAEVQVLKDGAGFARCLEIVKLPRTRTAP